MFRPHKEVWKVQKIWMFVLAALMLTALSACSDRTSVQTGAKSDYPAMLMIDGTLYYGTADRYENPVDAAVAQTVTSYTNSVPEKDGACNFDRSLKAKYILTERGLAVLVDGEWRLFRAEEQDAEPRVPSGTIRFYIGATCESETPVTEREAALTIRQVKSLKALLENVELWTDDDLCNRLDFVFDGEFEFEDDPERYRFSYENGVIYHGHYFAEIPDGQMRYICGIDTGSRWGLTLEADNVSSEGMTLRLIRSDIFTGELLTGAEFWLEAWDEARLCAEPLPTDPECVDWVTDATAIPNGETTEIAMDWGFLYGSLEPGSYRLGKEIMAVGGSGGNEKTLLYAYFEMK